MNSTSVSGQSQPSFSKSQAHSTSSFFCAKRWVASLRSASFMLPDTASAGTPRSFSSAAICSACLMDAQKMTVRLSRTNSIQVSTISWLRSGTKILLSRSRMLYCTLLKRTLVRSMLVWMRMQRTGTSSPISTAVWMSRRCAVFLKISRMS